MVISFGVVVPLVLPFGCLFFTLKYFVDKYNFLFGIWKVEQESAGAVASIAARYLLSAVAFLQVKSELMILAFHLLTKQHRQHIQTLINSHQFVMSGYFVAFGLRTSVHEVVPSDMVTVVTTGISKGRGLVLGGTLLFVVSLVSAVLLIGHSTDVFHVVKTRTPHATVSIETSYVLIEVVSIFPIFLNTSVTSILKVVIHVYNRFNFSVQVSASHLTPEQERVLCRSYVHPYEHEIEQKLAARGIHNHRGALGIEDP